MHMFQADTNLSVLNLTLHRSHLSAFAHEEGKHKQANEQSHAQTSSSQFLRVCLWLCVYGYLSGISINKMHTQKHKITPTFNLALNLPAYVLDKCACKGHRKNIKKRKKEKSHDHGSPRRSIHLGFALVCPGSACTW